MDCSIESTPHEDACIYSSAYDGGELMTQFGEPAQNDEITTRAHGENLRLLPILGLGRKNKSRRRWRTCKRESRVLPEVKETGGTSMVNHPQHHPLRHME